MKIINGLKIYLTDWKNLLTHGIVGVILLYCLLFAPVAWYWRVILLILVIAFNIARMKYSKNKKERMFMSSKGKYLVETPSIDYMNLHIQEKVQELRSQSEDELDYIKRSYHFVRDEIPHSWDIKANVVSKTASETLVNRTGVCWTKSSLFAALLRANQIPSGISYQRLTRADDDSEGYMIHALNTVYIKDLNRWIRLDARGNKENVNACFSLDEEKLAYPIRSEFGEIDYMDNHADLDERLVDILMESEDILEITTDFKF